MTFCSCSMPTSVTWRNDWQPKTLPKGRSSPKTTSIVRGDVESSTVDTHITGGLGLAKVREPSLASLFGRENNDYNDYVLGCDTQTTAREGHSLAKHISTREVPPARKNNSYYRKFTFYRAEREKICHFYLFHTTSREKFSRLPFFH